MAAAATTATADPEVPGYEVLERIGAGGFGVVFRARHRVIGREVALKIIHERHCTDPTAIARFLAEARAVNKVSHPNIVEISDFGELPDGRPYCVMELIRGRTLRTILDERGRIPLDEALPLLRGIAEAIDAAHAVGIAHRDLKPDNVFVLGDGSIKLIDFGLAKLTTEDASVTQTGQVFGTPLYMSPEQCRGRAITLATDAYSLGALAYHVVTGAPPFSGEPLDLALQHINDPPPPPTSRCAALPAAVDAAVLALLDKDPARRPARMVAAIAAMAGTAPVPVPRKTRALPIAGGMLACAAVGLGIYAAMPSHAQPHREGPWTRRSLHLDLDGIVENTAVTHNNHLLYRDESGVWRHDLATGKTQRIALAVERVHQVSTVEELPDGRLLIGYKKPLLTEIVDPVTRASSHVIDAGFSALSPDGDQVAAWDADNWLVVHSLRTHETRRLFQLSVGNIESPARWSPDSKQLLWGRGGTSAAGGPQVFVTRVSDGSTAPLTGLAQPMLRNETTEDFYSPIAFLQDGRIAYCTTNPARVVARPLWGGEVTTLTDLDETVSDCVVTPRGNGLFVTLGRSQATVGMFELDHPSGAPLVPRQVAGPTALLPVAADNHRLLTYRARPRSGLSRIQILDLDSGALTSGSECKDERFMVVRGQESLHVILRIEHDDAVLQLLAFESCALVEQWAISDVLRIGYPDCNANRCVVATTHRDHATVWLLESGRPAIERARLPFNGNDPPPNVAISADGRQLAVAVTETPRHALYVMAIDSGAPRRVPLVADFLDGVSWDARGQLLVSGQAIDGANFALVSIAPDDTRRILWSSNVTYLTTLSADPARRRLFGRIATWQQEFLLLDPAVTETGRSW